MKLQPCALVAALLSAQLLACQGQPELLCDRVRVLWPYFELDPDSDVSDEVGIQIELVLRTGLVAGTVVNLYVAPEGGDPVFSGSAEVETGGLLVFPSVTVPVGAVRLVIEGANDCGEFQTSRSIYVWDGLGLPGCSLALVEPTVSRVRFAQPVLNADNDPSPDKPGFQAHFIVDAGRPEMEVAFFVLDLNSGEQQELNLASDADGLANLSVNLGQGTWATRAICMWTAQERYWSSTTRSYHVDTQAPGCALVEPTEAVTAADDLDDDLDNGIQFELVAGVDGDDVDGELAEFVVNGAAISGVPVSAGEARAVGEFAGAQAPDTQELSFSTTDWAGNRCSAQRIFSP